MFAPGDIRSCRRALRAAMPQSESRQASIASP